MRNKKSKGEMMFRRCPPGGGQGEKQNVKYLPCLVSNGHWIYHGPQNNDYLDISKVRVSSFRVILQIRWHFGIGYFLSRFGVLTRHIYNIPIFDINETSIKYQ